MKAAQISWILYIININIFAAFLWVQKLPPKTAISTKKSHLTQNSETAPPTGPRSQLHLHTLKVDSLVQSIWSLQISSFIGFLCVPNMYLTKSFKGDVSEIWDTVQTQYQRWFYLHKSLFKTKGKMNSFYLLKSFQNNQTNNQSPS